ncbi:MAG: ATP-grasp domain-containing protein [Anaerolineae bacterium]|nr:ATP-grasp domain-containing protein [Anaerolineae bacterium]
MAEHRNHQPAALVTDAERGSALAIIRSLGRRGWRVIAASAAPDAPGFRSRYAAARVVYPSPVDDPRGATAALLGAARAHGVDLLIPVTDDVGLPLAAARAQFAGVCRVAMAGDEQIALVTDKQRTLALAEELGVPVPLTRQVRTAAEADAVAGDFGWPVVVKPQVSRLVDEGSGVDVLEVTYAADRDDLLRVVGQFEGRCPVLLQEYCPGEGHGVELLAYEGKPLAAFQHKRLHEVPVTGGASALRQSVALDPQLYEYARRLIAALKWTGLIMVEFKVGARGPRLMEINGRIWGSLPLAVFSGMDFPARLADLLLNGPPSLSAAPDTNYRIGVKARNLEKDIVWTLAVLAGRRHHPFLPAPGRWAALAALPGLLDPRTRTDSFAWDDPRPALAELPQIARKLLRKRGKGREAGQGNRVTNDLSGPISGARTFSPSPTPSPTQAEGRGAPRRILLFPL